MLSATPSPPLQVQALMAGPAGCAAHRAPPAGGRSFRLSRDGGAVLLQNPDGTERLMLLVSDLQRAKRDLQRREQEAAAQAALEPETYQVCASRTHRLRCAQQQMSS